MTTPTTFSVPDKMGSMKSFPDTWEWRAHQREIVDRAVNSPKKFVIIQAECGIGKSGIAMAVAEVTGKRTIVLIHSIDLQKQYLRDFGHLRMMTGRSNWTCNVTGESADSAPCTAGQACTFMGSWAHGRLIDNIIPVCNYYAQKAAVSRTQVQIHNYAYWMRETKSEMTTFGSVGTIICDEAHALDTILMDTAAVTLRLNDLVTLAGIKAPTAYDIPALQIWADSIADVIKTKSADLKEQAEAAGLSFSIGKDSDAPKSHVKSVSDLFNSDEKSRLAVTTVLRKIAAFRRISDFITTLGEAHRDGWVSISDVKGTKTPVINIKPIHGKPGFRHIIKSASDKVIMMSAYLAPSMLIETLGLDPDEVDVIDIDAVFDRSKSGVYYCPITKMKFNTPQGYFPIIMKTIENIRREFFPTGKGVIHVPSIHLRDSLMSNRHHLGIPMIAYDNSNSEYNRYPGKNEAINAFATSPNPCVLIGQSVSTGLDLKMIDFQVIIKLGFRPTTDPVIAARMKVDSVFYPFLTICDLVQAVGRAKRGDDNDGETIIIDEQFGWFYRANEKHFPMWFKNSLVYKGWDAMPKAKLALDGLKARGV